MIEATHLSKYFKVALPGKGLSGKIKGFFSPDNKIIKAVDDINYSIKPGEIVGYLGRNGAGKSTTIKLLTGVLVPSSGSVKVNVIIPSRNRRENSFHNQCWR